MTTIEEASVSNTTGDKNSAQYKANKARMAATKRLINTYQEEFNKLYGEEREQMGLSREPNPKTRKLTAEEKAEKLKNKLAALGFSVEIRPAA